MIARHTIELRHVGDLFDDLEGGTTIFLDSHLLKYSLGDHVLQN